MMDSLKQSLGFIPVYDDLPDPEIFDEGRFIIDYSQGKPLLKYSKAIEGENEEVEKVWVTVDGSDSPHPLAKMSDLDYHLRNRDWNITGRLFVGREEDEEPETENLSTQPPTSTSTTPTPIPSTTTLLPRTKMSSTWDLSKETGLEKGALYISTSELHHLIPSIEDELDSLCKISEELDEEAEKAFNSLYEELIHIKMKEWNNDTVDLGTLRYYDIISLRDIDAGSSIIDLIALGSSSYTNIVNLNNILGSDIGPKSTVVVGVEYTVSGKTYTKEISFIPFKVTEENVVSENFISKILDYAVIEYQSGCIRVFPQSKEVTECIISYCYISYDGLF